MLAPCPASIVNHIRGLMGIPFDSIRREHALMQTRRTMGFRDLNERRSVLGSE
jgi:hypothetical protein